jgi:hypothetical protein
VAKETLQVVLDHHLRVAVAAVCMVLAVTALLMDQCLLLLLQSVEDQTLVQVAERLCMVLTDLMAAAVVGWEFS